MRENKRFSLVNIPFMPFQTRRSPRVSEQSLTATVTVLTNLGEKMSDEEVDELLKAVDTSSGEINYLGQLFTS